MHESSKDTTDSSGTATVSSGGAAAEASGVAAEAPPVADLPSADDLVRAHALYNSILKEMKER